MIAQLYSITFLGDRFLIIERSTGRTVEVCKDLREGQRAVNRLTAAKVQGLDTEEEDFS